MCGGYSLVAGSNVLKKRFRAEPEDLSGGPNYNARPGQHLPVILNTARHKIRQAYWGYRPHWARPESSRAVINARSETLASKPYFKDSFLHRRCLVIADSFYEWKKTSSGKKPYLISLKTGEPFAMAGLWDENADNNGEMTPVFAIITVDANKDMAPIHERMPAILLPEKEDEWLSGDIAPADELKLLKPYPDHKIKTIAISKKVNYPGNNGSELHKAVY